MKYCNFIGLLILLAQPITCAWSHGEKLEAELVLDAKKLRTSSADDTSPEQAIEVATRKGLIEVIIAGLGNRDYTVRAKALDALRGFPAAQQRVALAQILNDDQIWFPELFGQRGMLQDWFAGKLAQVLRLYGITVEPDKLPFPVVRKSAAAQISQTTH